jgi:hypothetical protein
MAISVKNEAPALRRYQVRCAELERENRILHVQLEKRLDEALTSGEWLFVQGWLQQKVAHQKAVLDGLNRRIISQRFVLRTLDRLGRGLSLDEYREARDKVGEPLRDRIDAPDRFNVE